MEVSPLSSARGVKAVGLVGWVRGVGGVGVILECACVIGQVSLLLTP